jgi:uncharacterized protein
MRIDPLSRSLHCLLYGPPTLGHLMELCEENYRALLRLAPELTRSRGIGRSAQVPGLDLYLEVLEQTPYTTLLHLTYHFPHGEATQPDPDATLRAYHDAGQVEVLELRQTALPLPRGPQLESLGQKWRANLFIAKWLAYCLAQGHSFASSDCPNAVVAPC